MATPIEQLFRFPPFVRAKDAYSDLEKRDRLALNLLLLFFAVLVVYFGLWQPVNNFHNDTLDDRNRQLELLGYMRSTEVDARASGQGNSRNLSGQNLLSQVSRTAQQFGIKPNRLQPEGDNAVSVWFDGVAFNDLIRWLQHLENREQILIRQISVDRQDEPGRVSARIVLRT